MFFQGGTNTSYTYTDGGGNQLIKQKRKTNQKEAVSMAGLQVSWKQFSKGFLSGDSEKENPSTHSWRSLKSAAWSI